MNECIFEKQMIVLCLEICKLNRSSRLQCFIFRSGKNFQLFSNIFHWIWKSLHYREQVWSDSKFLFRFILFYLKWLTTIDSHKNNQIFVYFAYFSKAYLLMIIKSWIYYQLIFSLGLMVEMFTNWIYKIYFFKSVYK